MLLTFSFNYIYFCGIVSSQLQSWSRNQNKHSQLLRFADPFSKIDQWAIDTQMVNQQEHVLMLSDDPGL
jgi:hypothetical protein